MPFYTFVCVPCGGRPTDVFLKMAERDSTPVACSRCRKRMTRLTVYAFLTAPNEASHWPYDSDALVPRDAKMLARYGREGRLVKDRTGGVQVRIESPADYRRVCREQGVKPRGDYEKFSRSVTRPHAGRAKAFREAERKRLKKETRDALKSKGLL